MAKLLSDIQHPRRVGGVRRVVAAKGGSASGDDRSGFEHSTSASEEAPGRRSGSGASSVWHHLELDVKRKGRHAEHRPATVPDRSRFSVLVVDDTEAARYAMARTLRAAGYRTLEAASGAEALKLASSASAVVLDVYLCDLHGVEVCRILRHDPKTRELPIIHVSAVEIDSRHVEAGLEAGADMYLLAPVPRDELVAAVDALIGRAPGSAHL